MSWNGDYDTFDGEGVRATKMHHLDLLRGVQWMDAPSIVCAQGRASDRPTSARGRTAPGRLGLADSP